MNRTRVHAQYLRWTHLQAVAAVSCRGWNFLRAAAPRARNQSNMGVMERIRGAGTEQASYRPGIKGASGPQLSREVAHGNARRDGRQAIMQGIVCEATAVRRKARNGTSMHEPRPSVISASFTSHMVHPLASSPCAVSVYVRAESFANKKNRFLTSSSTSMKLRATGNSGASG